MNRFEEVAAEVEGNPSPDDLRKQAQEKKDAEIARIKFIQMQNGSDTIHTTMPPGVWIDYTDV